MLFYLLFFYRLAEQFSHFYRIIVIAYFIWSTTNICCSLLQLHVVRFAKFYDFILKRKKNFFLFFILKIKHISNDLILLQLMNTLTGDEFQKICVNIFWAYGQIFLLCFFGERLSNSFEDLSTDIFHCNWYKFPVKSQRFLNTMLLASQNPVSMRGFGSTICSRDSFKMVLNLTNLEGLFPIKNGFVPLN